MTKPGLTLYRPVSLNREYLTEKMLEQYKERHAKTWSDFSLEQRGEVREAFLVTVQSLEESLATGSPAFLLDHAGRVHSRFTAGHFPPAFAISFFELVRVVISKELPPDYRKNAGAFVRKTVSTLKSQAAGTVTPPVSGPPLSRQGRSFLNAALAGDSGRAGKVIDKALAAGMPVREIYSDIFQPVLIETGKLWQENKATIAQEHYVTGVVRRNMERLHDHVAATKTPARQEKTVVAACVGEELHEIGILMVADFFAMDGWKVYYIGANMPAKSILAAVKEQEADAVVLSITLPSRLTSLRYLIRSLRADPETANVKIVVGGFPFGILPDLWKQVGADAVAAGAQDAVIAASRLTGRI
jgi:MerR family transcriptional regulator, light-induced transcriptional regulator